MKSGLEIAQEAELRPIADIAAAAGIEPDELELYGQYRAKVDLSILDRLAGEPDGKLVITTAITPTKAGEGKTTTSVSLTQGLGKIGKNVMLCLREPSHGAGVRHQGRRQRRRLRAGRADGGDQPPLQRRLPRRARPPTTCSPRRSTRAIYHGNPLDIDPATITWPRTLDMNDRELRYTRRSASAARRTASRARTSSSSPPRPRSWRCSRSRATCRTCARRLGRIVVASHLRRQAGDRRRPQGRAAR